MTFHLSCHPDPLPDTPVRFAVTNVTLHGLLDLPVGRLRIFCKQRRGLHQLPVLAIAALRHSALLPGLLQRMFPPGAQPLDGKDFLPCQTLHRGNATAYRLAIDMHGAGPAQPPLRHLYLVPVSPSASRRYDKSGISGSPENERLTPLTMNVIFFTGFSFWPARAGQGNPLFVPIGPEKQRVVQLKLISYKSRKQYPFPPPCTREKGRTGRRAWEADAHVRWMGKGREKVD